MKSTIITSTLVAAAFAASGIAQAGTIGITGSYAGTHNIEAWQMGGGMLGSASGLAWTFNFNGASGSFTADGGSLLGNPVTIGGALTLVEGSGGQYTGAYDIAIGANGPGSTTITWDVLDDGLGNLTFTTMNTDGGHRGTLLTGVMPFPIDIVMDGTASAVPVPAAVWLFGSGLMGLVGVARRHKARA